MAVMCKTRSAIKVTGRLIHEALSFVVFSALDLLDVLLCLTYKVTDFFVEAEWRPCYCTSAREAVTSSGKILVSEQGESKIVCLTSGSKLELEEISDTLYARASVLSEVSKSTVNELNKRIKVDRTVVQSASCHNKTARGLTRTFTVSSTVVEMLRGKVGGGKQSLYPIPRWSDCDCKLCTSWTTSSKESLFVSTQGPRGKAKEEVIFIHGFISSSAFWTETVFPSFSTAAKSTCRLFAVDLLGFGRSPKPTDSLYTLKDHVDMIESSVLDAHKVKSFHIVAHSLGCILALALAVKHPNSVKSLTLIAPPYYPVPKGAQATQYVMRKVAPRKLWPLISFGSSIACWYEHISRTICLLICKNHRIWEFLTKLVTRNRIRTFLIEGFMCHTHNAAWHTLHNIICGTANKLDSYLDAIRDNLKCPVTVFHGEHDEVIPVECSYNVRDKVPRAEVKVLKNRDHITIVVGRQEEFARELEEIWRLSSN